MDTLFVITLLITVVGAGTIEDESSCPPEQGIELGFSSPQQNGSLAWNGQLFPRGTWWQQNHKYFACPCALGKCIIRVCSTNDSRPPDEPFPLQISEAGRSREVSSHSHFIPLVHEDVQWCTDLRTMTGQAAGKEENVSMVTVALVEGESQDEHHFLHNGSLVINGTGMQHHPAEYCLINFGNDSLEVVLCVSSSPQTESTKSLLHTIYPIFLLISVVFLGLTLLVYGLLPELTRNLHGRCQVSHAAALMVGFLFLAIAQIHGDTVGDIGCYVIGFSTYFFLLAAFFWLNVMCFDIYWTFSGINRMASSLQSTPHKKFLRYSCYAWGVPFILLVTAISAQLNLGTQPESILNPGVGAEQCLMRDHSWSSPSVIYFHGIISLLLLLNIIFFLITTVKMLRLRRESMVLHNGPSRRHTGDSAQDEKRFFLYIKLFLIMGILWIMEIVSWAVGGPPEWWYVTDIFNTLQGVLIFLLFVVRTRVRQLLLARVRPERTDTRSSSQSVGRAAESRSSEMSNITATSLNMSAVSVNNDSNNGSRIPSTDSNQPQSVASSRAELQNYF